MGETVGIAELWRRLSEDLRRVRRGTRSMVLDREAIARMIAYVATVPSRC